MPCELIEDGYTLTAEVHGLNFRYRPAPGVEWVAGLEWVTRLEPEAGQAKICEMLAARIVEWDATIGGEPAGVTAGNIAKLPPAVYAGLRAKINSFAEPDSDDGSKNSEAG